MRHWGFLTGWPGTCSTSLQYISGPSDPQVALAEISAMDARFNTAGKSPAERTGRQRLRWGREIRQKWVYKASHVFKYPLNIRKVRVCLSGEQRQGLSNCNSSVLQGLVELLFRYVSPNASFISEIILSRQRGWKQQDANVVSSSPQHVSDHFHCHRQQLLTHFHPLILVSARSLSWNIVWHQLFLINLL